MKPIEVDNTEVTVIAYKAKDGKLFLERKERDEYNKKLLNKELIEHIAENCDRSVCDDYNTEYHTDSDIAKYFEEHFETIKILLEK